MLSELEVKEKRLIRQPVWEADTTLKRALRWCLSNVHKIIIIPVSDLITLLEPSQLHLTQTYIHTPRMSEFTSFSLPFYLPCASGLFRCTGVFACDLKMQVKFPSHLWKPHLSAEFTIWSHLLQQCFEVYLHCDWLPGALFPPLSFLPSSVLRSLSPLFPSAFSSQSFPISLTLLTFSLSLYLSSYPFLHFFLNSSIHSLLSFFFASEPKIDLNGWGHGELSTLWSYGRYRLC